MPRREKSLKHGQCRGRKGDRIAAWEWDWRGVLEWGHNHPGRVWDRRPPCQNPEPEEGLLHARLHVQMLVTALGTGLARQKLGRNLVTLGLRRWMTHRKIVQGQGANLDTGFMGLPLLMARPDTPSPLAHLNGVVDRLWGSVQEPQ